MKAGRELDKLVAIEIMGYYNCPNHESLPAFHHEEQTDQFPGKKYPMNLNELPRYSTSISAAWKVYEKSLLGCDISYNKHLDKYFVTNVSEDFRYILDQTRKEYMQWMNKDTICGLGQTAPLAICMAALQTVGIDIE